MPLVLTNKVATSVGAPITLTMLGGDIPFTDYLPMDDLSFGSFPEYEYGCLYPRLAFVDETTPLHYVFRDSGDPFEAIDIWGCTELIHGSSHTFPLGGTQGDTFYAYGGGSFLCVDSTIGFLRSGSSGPSLTGPGPGPQQVEIEFGSWEGATIGNVNTTGIISTTPFLIESEFGVVASLSPGGVSGPPLLWSPAYNNSFKSSSGLVYMPGNFDYYDFDARDPVGNRNQWQAIRYDPGSSDWEMFSLVDLGAATFPLPGPSAFFELTAAQPGIIGEEIALVFRLYPDGGKGGLDEQMVYCKTTPNPSYDCGPLTGGVPPTTATVPADTELADCFTPVLDGIAGDLKFKVIQGCPQGFIVYNYNNPFTFWMVNRDWTTYQEYNVVKGNLSACTAHLEATTEGKDAILKWVSTGVFIILEDTDSGSPTRLRVGVPSEIWGGCPHEGGTGEDPPGEGPGPGGGPNLTIQFFPSIQQGLDPFTGPLLRLLPSPYPPPE